MRTVWYCGINENNVVRTYVRSFGDDGISIFFGHMSVYIPGLSSEVKNI